MHWSRRAVLRGARAFALASVALFALGTGARAATIPFTFSTTPDATPIFSPSGNTVFDLTGNSGSGDAAANGGTGTDIKVGTFAITPPSAANSPDNLTPTNFGFTITITDTASGDVGNFDLTGMLTGQASNNASNIGFVFTGVAPPTITLGGKPYTVTPKFLDVPTVQADGSTREGSLTAHVVAAVPEPASVALLGMGVVGAWGLFHRRARAR